MKQIIFLFLILFAILAAIPLSKHFFLKEPISFGKKQTGENKTATINNHTFILKIANSVEEKQIGLSGIDSLPRDQGMLFSFYSKDYHSFWMKDVKFPIDIIYIDDDTVITVVSRAEPATTENPQVYKPEEPANKVLEINAGLSEEYGIKKGDKVIFSL
jgi:uncharacterized membrane protein (UPF0127 family)